MAHGVVRTDKMFGTDNRTGLWTLQYLPSNTATAVDNGNVVVRGDLVTGEREIYKASTPTTTTALEDVVLVATPEVEYDARKYAIDEFENKAGALLRGYSLKPGCIFSVTKDALGGSSSPAVGNLVELQAGTKLKVVASATANTTQVGKIIAIETVGRFTYYVIQVG